MQQTDLIREDWAAASEIAGKFPNMKCLEAAAALNKKFGSDVTVLYVDTNPYCLRPYIIHKSLPRDIMSETGLHFAVELHGKVFDNLTPMGASMKEWMSAFGFAHKEQDEGSFADVAITRWTYQEFLTYLKRSGRTPLGKPRKTLSSPSLLGRKFGGRT